MAIAVKIQETLQQRAKALALRTDEKEVFSTDLLQIVEFEIAGEHYALEANSVREVAYFKNYTPFPGMQAVMLGMVNVRGKIFSLLDLKCVFGLARAEDHNHNIMILLSHPKLQLGFPIDSLVGIKKLPKNSVQASLEKLGAKKFEYIQGTTTEGLALINIDKIFYEYGGKE